MRTDETICITRSPLEPQYDHKIIKACMPQGMKKKDLNYNDLQEFPVAIRTLSKLQELGFHNNNIKTIPERAFAGNPQLQTIHFYENPIQLVGKPVSSFLPKLHTCKNSLNGATQIQEFPDLKGTSSLEILTLTRAGLSALPPDLCEQLPRLRVLELSYNQIQHLPSFYRCSSLQEMCHNQIRRIESSTFQQLTSLRALDLSWNMITWIHPDAFASLQSLMKLDLTENQLSSVPVAGLGGLTHLKLRGNVELYDAFSPDHFPRMRVVEMPYAYQCCVYGSCDSYKAAGQWGTEQSHADEDLHKRTAPVYPVHTTLTWRSSQLEIEESKLQTSVQCTPTPGPFCPCDSLLGSWPVRVGLWFISLVALLGNSFLLLSLFSSPSYLSPLRFTVACMGGSNLLTGMCTGTLAFVDALTLGEFADHGARWEAGSGSSVLLLTLAAVQCGVSMTCARVYGKLPSFGSVRTSALFCLALSLTLASLPLAIGVGDVWILAFLSALAIATPLLSTALLAGLFLSAHHDEHFVFADSNGFTYPPLLGAASRRG
uniref:Leucine rich repeat containing G protein-coupled receptor 6 n=1 Tax=Tetraodon nigroviridis TaxID=99883 RepID=H3DC37_TETNG